MAGRIGAKLIMELREQGASRRSIASSRRMSMGSVCEVFDIAAERGVTWEQVRDMPENEVCRLFYPGRHARGSVFEEPDWDYAHKEMAKVGVNLRPLHDECKAGRAARHAVAMGCTKFCEGYGDHVAANGPTKRIEHKAGVSCEVDWSGPTPGGGLVDPVTGEVSKAYLFVGVLPFSQKAHFEPALDMEGRTWPRCHVHMFEYRGGVPGRAACDDLETGVVKHPREGGIVLNDAYEAPGEHHMTAITPAQARKPKQEASAEGTVGDAATRVTARLRDRVFTGLGELPHAVRECLGDYSAHPFQKREGSRDPVFSEVEAERLRPLPAVRYDVAQRACNRSVGLDFHVVHAKNRYSAPCRCAGCKADLRVGESTVGIYHAGERVAAHPLPPPYASNAHQTDPSHTPNGPRRPERDDARIKRRAAGVGPCCAAVAGRISEGVKIRERAYNPAPSAPGPSKGYGGRRLEAACAHAPPKPRSPRRRRLKATPGSGPDAGRGPEGKAAPAGGPRGHVRGADHYRDGARRPGGGGGGRDGRRGDAPQAARDGDGRDGGGARPPGGRRDRDVGAVRGPRQDDGGLRLRGEARGERQAPGGGGEAAVPGRGDGLDDPRGAGPGRGADPRDRRVPIRVLRRERGDRGLRRHREEPPRLPPGRAGLQDARGRALRAPARPADGARRARRHRAPQRQDTGEVRPLRAARPRRAADRGRRRPGRQLPVRARGEAPHVRVDGAVHPVRPSGVARAPRRRRAGRHDGRPPRARVGPHRPRRRQRAQDAGREEVAIRARGTGGTQNA